MVQFLVFSDLEVVANHIDGGEDYFCVDSKPIEVCRLARGKRCKMGEMLILQQRQTLDIVHHKVSITLDISYMHYVV